MFVARWIKALCSREYRHRVLDFELFILTLPGLASVKFRRGFYHLSSASISHTVHDDDVTTEAQKLAAAQIANATNHREGNIARTSPSSPAGSIGGTSGSGVSATGEFFGEQGSSTRTKSLVDAGSLGY